MGQTFEAEARPATNGTKSSENVLCDVAMAELDTMRASVSDFPNQDPADILVTIAGIAGRLAEIRAQLHRSGSQRCTALRTREVDPLRDDLDFQFRIHSRRIALLEWELKMSTGGI